MKALPYKPRYYRLRRNAERRAAELRRLRPDYTFYVAITSDFRYAVFTTEGAICA